MGTTMVMALAGNNRIYIANVGDSRVYLFNKPNLWQLTEDHSMINDQLRAGLLTEDQAKNYLGRNVITRSVGYERDVSPDIIERDINMGEIYLLCSDGLHGMASDFVISDIFSKWNGDDVSKTLVKAALDGGGDDNVTVMVFQITPKN
jgi:protein phosphatase